MAAVSPPTFLPLPPSFFFIPSSHHSPGGHGNGTITVKTQGLGPSPAAARSIPAARHLVLGSQREEAFTGPQDRTEVGHGASWEQWHSLCPLSGVQQQGEGAVGLGVGRGAGHSRELPPRALPTQLHVSSQRPL